MKETGNIRKEKKASPNKWKKILREYLGSYVTLLIGIILSFISFFLLHNQNFRSLEDSFKHDSTIRSLALQHKIEVLEQFWEDIRAFYAASAQITEEEFNRFSGMVLKHSNFSFISWVPAPHAAITPEQILLAAKNEAKEAAIRKLITQGTIKNLIRNTYLHCEVAFCPEAVFLLTENVSGERGLAVMVPVFLNSTAATTHSPPTGFVICFLPMDPFFAPILQNANSYAQEVSVYLIDWTGHRPEIFQTTLNPDKIPGQRLPERLRKPGAAFSDTIPLGTGLLEIIIQPHFSFLSRDIIRISDWLVLILSLTLTIIMARSLYRKINRDVVIQKIIDKRTRKLAFDEHRIHAMINNALDAVISIDQNGKIIEWNKRAEKMFGWSHDEIIGQEMAKIIIPHAYRRRHYRGMKKYLTTGDAKILNRRFKTEALAKNGETFPIELTVTVSMLDGKHYFTAFIRNLSDICKP